MSEEFVGFGTKDLGGAGRAGKRVVQTGIKILPRWNVKRAPKPKPRRPR